MITLAEDIQHLCSVDFSEIEISENYISGLLWLQTVKLNIK